jgi:hypothetical protein
MSSGKIQKLMRRIRCKRKRNTEFYVIGISPATEQPAEFHTGEELAAEQRDDFRSLLYKEVPSYADLRRMSQPLLEDAQLNLLILNALRLSLEFADLICDGYSQDSFYGDEGEGTKDSRIEANARYFCRLDRLRVPRNSELRLRLIKELHDSSSAGHLGVASILAKALDRFWWKRIRQAVKDFCERWVVSR